jgi:hypothetical protein
MIFILSGNETLSTNLELVQEKTGNQSQMKHYKPMLTGCEPLLRSAVKMSKEDYRTFQYADLI